MSFFEFPHTRTYDGDLGWLIKHTSSYDEVISTLQEWIDTNTPKIDELIDFMNQMLAGDIPEGLKEALYSWASENIVDLIAAALKVVTFGLTDDGHFCAWYALSWSDIQFNTTEYDIFIPEQTEYGHLTLSYK